MKAIVFVLRGCSASWLGAYGNEWIATPNLDRFAAEGVVFDRHISDCPEHTAACHAWLNGVSAPRSGPEGQNLTAVLRAAGVKTILVRANHPDSDSPDWFYAGWDEQFDARPQEDDRLTLDPLVRALPSLLDRLESVQNSLLWIDIDGLLPPWNIRQEVFEAYVQDDEPETVEEQEDDDGDDEEEDANEEEMSEESYESEDESEPVAAEEPREPVTPWSDPPTGPFDVKDLDAREWLQCSLAAVMTGLDAELGLVFELFRARGLDRSAALILTSDYGFPLGEHGQIGPYRPWLHEELVHLPLMIRFPEAKEACRRVGQFTQPRDIAPTLQDLFGLKMESASGMSLVPLARGESRTGREKAITKLETETAAETSIRTEDWAFLLPLKVPEGETRQPQLFRKPDDRWEVNDMRSRNIERCDEFEEQLKGRNEN